MPSIVMKKEKDCKHSVRYVSNDSDAVLTNVYLSKGFADEMPDKITVSVEAGGGTKSKKSKRDKEVSPPEEG